MTDSLINLLEPYNTICVVRLRTSIWSDQRGIYQKKSLTYLNKKCVGFNFVKEDVTMGGVECVLPRIINLDSCEDGVYSVVSCNESKDFETGYVDDYDYKLIPFIVVPEKGIVS